MRTRRGAKPCLGGLLRAALLVAVALLPLLPGRSIAASLPATPAVPVITSIGPATVGPGTTVTITGTGFSGPGFTTATVLFDGVAATISSVTPTQVTAVVPTLPAGTVLTTVVLSNGEVSVTAPGVIPPVNVLPSLTPVPLPPAPAVGGLPSPTPVLPPSSALPQPATGQPSAAPAASPTAVPLAVTAIDPGQAAPGQWITVTGTGFGGDGGSKVTSVAVNGQPAGYTVVSPSQVRVRVPAVPAGPASVSVVVSNGPNSRTVSGTGLQVLASADIPAPVGPAAAVSSGFFDSLLHPRGPVQLVVDVLLLLALLTGVGTAGVIVMRRLRPGRRRKLKV